MRSLIVVWFLASGLALFAESVPEKSAAVDSRALIPKEKVTLAAVEAAMTKGVDFLVGKQNADGSFGSARRTKELNIYAPLPGAQDAYLAGTSGLAISGLIDAHDSRPEVKAAIEKSEKWAFATLPGLRRADATTTYNAWGHAYGLRAISRLYQAAAGDATRQAALKALAQQQAGLADRYEYLDGGWGYLHLFEEPKTQKPSGITTSFTTASVLLAMHEARETMGITLNPKIVGSSLASIRRQQFPDFTYAYSHGHRLVPHDEINRRNGSLGRSQACNAALRAFGDPKITDAVLTKWADNFVEFEHWLDHGRKKPVPHESTFKIAGYFYYYGIYYFTVSAQYLPQEKQSELARALARILLTRQEKDGSWWDYPLYDYGQAYGTGYALMSLKWCRETMRSGTPPPSQ
jgi:Prenyltransferase and squalene oxidase repeat